MLKSSGSGDIFNRLYKKGGPSDDQTNLIMENVYFLNRNCKFLSFAEKENLIILLKKRDPELEEIIHTFKDTKVSKDKMKDTLYAILYPKRFTKKHNENLNPAASINELKSSRMRKSPNAKEHRKDLPSFSGKPDEALSASIKQNRLSENPFTDSQRKLEHSNSSGFNKASLTSSQLSEKTFGTERKAGNGSIGPQGQGSQPVKKRTRQQSEYEIISHRYQSHQKRMSEMDLYIEKLHQQKDEYLKSGDLTQQVEAKSGKNASNVMMKHYQSQMLPVDESPYQIKRHMSSVDQTAVDNAKKLASKRPERTRVQENSRGRIPSCSPVRYNHEDSKLDMMSCSVIHPDMNRSFREQEISYRSQPKHGEALSRSDLDLDNNNNTNKWLDEKHRNLLFGNEFDLNASREEGPNARLTAEFNVKNDPNSIVAGPRKVQESIDSHLKNPMDRESGEDFVNIGSRPKLLTSFGSRDFKESRQGNFFKESTASKGPTSLVQISVETLGKKQDPAEFDEKSSIEFMTRSQISYNNKGTFAPNTPMSQSMISVNENYRADSSKYMTNPAMSFDPGVKFMKTGDKIPSFISVDGYMSRYETRPVSPMGGDLNKSSLDTSINGVSRSERFISVNLLKKIFDDVMIFAEDIVDEVFRYIGEHIVNKNYFVQIMTSFLSGVPAKHGVKPKEIATKIFEICDRNGDGMISANDLGSRVTLFTQHKDTNSREKKVYDLLDPSGRGFIIENDLITSLTKAQALACSIGTNLFEDQQEILEEARRIFKELDREGKGVVTYWDIFLWKDTESFADLAQKLEKYSAKSESLVLGKAASLSMISPIGNKDIFFYGSAQKSYDNYNLTSIVNDFKPFTSVFQPTEKKDLTPKTFNKPLEIPSNKPPKRETSPVATRNKSPEKPLLETPSSLVAHDTPLKSPQAQETPKTKAFSPAMAFKVNSSVMQEILMKSPQETPKANIVKEASPEMPKEIFRGMSFKMNSPLVEQETPVKSPVKIAEETSKTKEFSPMKAQETPKTKEFSPMKKQETPNTMSFEEKSPTMTSGNKSEGGINLVQLRETADFTGFERETLSFGDYRHMAVDETPGFAGYDQVMGDFTSYTKDTSDFTASDKDAGEFGVSPREEGSGVKEGSKGNGQEVKKRRYQVETFLQYKARQLGEDLVINNLQSVKAFQLGRYAMPIFSTKGRKEGKIKGDSEITDGMTSVEKKDEEFVEF